MRNVPRDEISLHNFQRTRFAAALPLIFLHFFVRDVNLSSLLHEKDQAKSTGSIGSNLVKYRSVKSARRADVRFEQALAMEQPFCTNVGYFS